jgi:DNA gyrase/topoisomerase IV subunit B
MEVVKFFPISSMAPTFLRLSSTGSRGRRTYVSCGGLRGLHNKFDGTHVPNLKNVGTHVLNTFPEKNKKYKNEKLDTHNITCNTIYQIQYRFQTY